MLKQTVLFKEKERIDRNVIRKLRLVEYVTDDHEACITPLPFELNADPQPPVSEALLSN